MRSSKSRSRNKNNRNRSVGNIVNRVFDSSGPEGKVRGTPQQIIDKYNQLARDAQLSNDRVATENFQQHAEHYLRMLAEAQREQAERQAQQQQQNEARQRRNQNEESGDGTQPSESPDGQTPVETAGTPSEGGGRRDRPRRQKTEDVIEFDGNGESGLVETPEEKPQRQRRPRKKPEEASAASEPEASSGEAPAQDAAE